GGDTAGDSESEAEEAAEDAGDALVGLAGQILRELVGDHDQDGDDRHQHLGERILVLSERTKRRVAHCVCPHRLKLPDECSLSEAGRPRWCCSYTLISPTATDCWDEFAAALLRVCVRIRGSDRPGGRRANEIEMRATALLNSTSKTVSTQNQFILTENIGEEMNGNERGIGVVGLAFDLIMKATKDRFELMQRLIPFSTPRFNTGHKSTRDRNYIWGGLLWGMGMALCKEATSRSWRMTG